MVAAFEQSLSNMTSRLQHLTSTSEQKVRSSVAVECIFNSPRTTGGQEKQCIAFQLE